ncbi:zincin [Meira miltonrushii]|uniref:Zincin n=1 Tax=Meira miltonrushii TaxID=1280837 RepID=A0A316VG90_9BASI|nr:zincin [Meira miltonrushii]PWN35343.1 zincin [Meira miltonrushii]
MASSQQYGRPSTDDVDENRPLLHDDLEDNRDRPFYDRILEQLKDPKSLRPLEKVLAAISLLFIILFIIFVSLYANTKARIDHGKPDEQLPLPGGEKVCTSKHCVLTASDLLRSIDTTVDPCDDFYHFSVGNWLNEHPIPADAGVYGMAQKIGDDNARLMKKFLEEEDDGPTIMKHSKDDIDKRNIAKLRSFYQSCMDTSSQDKAGAKPVLDVISNLWKLLMKDEKEDMDFSTMFNSAAETEDWNGIYIDEPVIPPNRPPARHPPTEKPRPLPPRNGRQRGFTEALASAHSQGLPALFEWFTEGEPVKDPKLGTAYLSPSGLGFPDKVYYDDEDELSFYEKRIEESFLLAVEAQHDKKKRRPTEKEVKKLAKLVVEFEKNIAKITPDGEDLEDPIATYNPTTVSSLSYTFSGIDWPTYLAALTVRVPKEVIVQSPNFLKRLDALVSRTKTEVLGAYLAWTALRTFGLQLGPNVPLRKPIDALDRRSKGVEDDVKEDRSTICFAATNDALGYLLGHFYVQEAFSIRARNIATGIIDSIIGAFKSRLPELDWLDPKTRKKAEVKADAVKIKVGWPLSPNTTDGTAIEKYYADLKVDKEDYYGNVARKMQRDAKRQWASIERQLDPESWDMIPSEVNAYYNPSANEIVFPAGILQPSYFSEYWPSYLQYGAFGNVAGHELSHAFDPNGRLFDENGRLHDWWTNDTAKAFNERRDCLIDQYSNYTIPNGKGGKEHLRGRFTIGEDVADAGGMAQSYRAWKTTLKEGGQEALDANPLLPGLDYSREQLFFVAFAIGWARNIRIQEAVRRLRTDEHSATKFRVIGTLSNNPDFAEVWGCKAGKDRMARSEEERCAIW